MDDPLILEVDSIDFIVARDEPVRIVRSIVAVQRLGDPTFEAWAGPENRRARVAARHAARDLAFMRGEGW